MSILGLYNYDNTILDGIVVPSGMAQSIVKNNILLELSELEIVYTNPDFLKMAIAEWSKKELRIWEKLWSTEHLEYNPIWNLNRTEEYDNLETRDLNVNNTSTRDLNNTSVNSGGDTVHEYTFGYNEDGAKESGRNLSELASRNVVDDTGTVVNNVDDTGTVHHVNTATMQGSIGVITSQTMIAQEREIDKFNTLDYIISSFKKRFCILVY